MKIAVSYLKTPYTKEETIKKIENTSADYIHVDLIDGFFVPNKNFTWEEVNNLLVYCKKPLDIHLMTLDLEENINASFNVKPKRISFHLEATKEPMKFIKKIKERSVEVGLAINPETEIDQLRPYLNEIDFVLILSVAPGKGGQSFLLSTVEKIQELKRLQKEISFQIEVDGGINSETIPLIKNDADIIVSGSYICESKDFEKQIQILRKKAE